MLSKNILILIAGIFWSSVGIMLIVIALKRWYFNLSEIQSIIIPIIALLIGVLKSKFILNKFAEKNIIRIKQYKKKVCAFAFQSWKSYVLTGFMIGLGVFFKTSKFIPETILTVIYIGIGLTLIFSSFRYYISFYKC